MQLGLKICNLQDPSGEDGRDAELALDGNLETKNSVDGKHEDKDIQTEVKSAA